MKTVIVALNSKYIHSSLAPWYLKQACNKGCGDVAVREFTINEDRESVLSVIYREKADVVAFSCYIWNIGRVLRLAENIRMLMPDIVIILGGPEVSFDSEKILKDFKYVDYVISGEGEMPFCELLECLHTNNTEKLKSIKGLTLRGSNGDSVCNHPGDLIKPDMIPSPYSEEMLDSVKGRIAYFESSRGCPFSCTYCLSSTTHGVRYFPMDRVKRDLARLVNAGARQVKFVDRTFNCNRERAKEIIRYILENFNYTSTSDDSSGMINFHFEAAADLFDDEMLQLLIKAPKGIFQLEIGIQSLNEKTLAAVDRKTDIIKALRNIKQLIEPDNVHIHLDLIAGLPYEDFSSFKESFNTVYDLAPHALQLGFLKLLKGSVIRRDAAKYGYVYRCYAPYEILGNIYTSYDEIIILKEIEELLDRLYNSGRFKYSLEYIINNYFESPFDFYLGLSRFISDNGIVIQGIPARELYKLILEYATTLPVAKPDIFKELLKLDFLATDNSGHLPSCLDRINLEGFQDKCFSFLRDEAMIRKYLPGFTGMPAKQIYKKVHFEIFSRDVLNISSTPGNMDTILAVYLFDYSYKSPVASRYGFEKVSL